MNRRIISILIFIFCAGNFFSQKYHVHLFSKKYHVHLSAELGYKFNNDFTTYYKDLKPFYYSGATADLLLKIHKSEIILGVRYMPFLSSVKPEIGFNRYLHANAESKFNYFIHTTVFFNNFSYNNKVGYENYNYHLNGIVPVDYNEVRFQGFVHDICFGIKMGFTQRLSADFIFGGGYFYSKRDFVEGKILKEKTKDHYWGPTYTARFSLKYVLGHKPKVEEGFEDDDEH